MRKRVTIEKNCYCHTCKKRFHYLGINMHRAAHRNRNEDCKITYTYGDTKTFKFSQNVKTIQQPDKCIKCGRNIYGLDHHDGVCFNCE